MYLNIQDRIFDTLVDTKKIYVAIKAKFTFREYQLSDGTTPLVLTITGSKQRERINLPDLSVDTEFWDSGKNRLKPVTKELIEKNLILDNIMAKITSIKTQYHLNERILTPALTRHEFLNGMSRVLFVPFFEANLELEKPSLAIGTYKRHLSVVKKVKAYSPELTFLDMDYEWFKKYKWHLAKLGNQKTTIAANITSIKKFLAQAERAGIRLKVNLDEIISGSTKGNRTALGPHEVKKLISYYYSEFINPAYKLVLGYFLFSCMTGLRISDVQQLTRKSFIDGYVTLISQKTKKDQSISLNDTVQRILAHEPKLFIEKYTDQHINDELKKIMKLVGITKVVTFHVARHTFATSFIRAGGSVTKLQMLLGHNKIEQTMIYVHMVQAEANSEIHLLDDMFNS